MIKQAIIALLLCATSFGITPAQRQWMLGGPVYPPLAGLSHWSFGNDGTNALARVGNNGHYVGANMMHFDGVSMNMRTIAPDPADDVLMWARFNDVSTTSYNKVVGTYQWTGSATDYFLFGHTGGRWAAAYGNITQTYTAEADTADNEWHLFRFYLGKLYVDGVEVLDLSSGVFSGTITLKFAVGGRGNADTTCNSHTDMDIGWISIGNKCKYVFSEGAGVPYDISGNGVVPILYNSPVWTTDLSGLNPSHNLLYGFTYSGGVYIPALEDGSEDAAGNPIDTPAGALHNGCEVKLVIDGLTNSFADLQLWNGADGGPIKNAFIYDAEPANTNALNIYCNLFDGVWTNR